MEFDYDEGDKNGLEYSHGNASPHYENLKQVTQKMCHSVFKGLVSANGKDARGKQVWCDGTVYEGNYKNGMWNGLGRLVSVDGALYEGQFKDNTACGEGKFITYENDFTEANWRENMPNGRGTWRSADGREYTGDFVHGKPEGNGNLLSGYIVPHHDAEAVRAFIYTGEFRNGKFNGWGKYERYDGSSYEGEWENGMIHGDGEFKYRSDRDGCRQVYKGSFYHGKKQGNGNLTFPNGMVFTGDWLNGKMHGMGQLFNNGAGVCEGVWKHGVFENQLMTSQIGFE